MELSDITYQNHGDYYIFSHKPNTRVYLGDYDPEDYVWQEKEQLKRSASEYIDEDGEADFSYDFKRKVPLEGGVGSKGRSAEYVKGFRQQAHKYAFNFSDEQEKKLQIDVMKTHYMTLFEMQPIYNLVLMDGDSYFVDDEGKRITQEEQKALVKGKLENCAQRLATMDFENGERV